MKRWQTGWRCLAGMVVMLAACGGGGGSSASTAANSSSSSSSNSSGSVASSSSSSVTVTTVVGAEPGMDGDANQVTFSTITGMVRVGNDIYLTDRCAVRKMNPASGAVTTLAGKVGECGRVDGTSGAARLGWHVAIASDGSNLYLAESSAVRRLSLATGKVTTIVAGGDFVSGMVFAGGKLYLSHRDTHSISRLDPNSGVVTTFAGLPSTAGSADGVGVAARLNRPMGMATDGASIYVGQSDSQTVRKIEIATATVSTLKPSGLTSSSLKQLALDGNALYVTDEMGYGIDKIDLTTLTVTRLPLLIRANSGVSAEGGFVSDGSNLYVGGRILYAGNMPVITKVNLAQPTNITLFSGSPGVDGNGTNARLNSPASMVGDGSFIYIADSYAHAIRKYDPATGAVTTLAGQLGKPGSDDGTGSNARFVFPIALAIEGGNLYVTDRESQAVRKIVLATGAVSTLAGDKDTSGSTDGVGSLARFKYPGYIVGDKNGNLYVADGGNCTIRKIVAATGAVTTVAGTTGACEKVDGTGSMAHFKGLGKLAIYGNDLYIDDYGLRKMNLTSLAVSTPTLSGYVKFSYGILAMTGVGQHLYINPSFHEGLYKFDMTDNTVTPVLMGDTEWSGMVLHGNALYVSDPVSNTISKITGF